jgi:hypothetical protein
LKVVMIILVGANFSNLDNRLTTTRMASILLHLGSWVMKSMETFSHGSLRIGRGLYNPFFSYGFHDLALDTSAHEMFYILFHFKPIKPFSYYHLCGSFIIIPHHGHVMFFLHDICSQLPYWHIGPNSRSRNPKGLSHMKNSLKYLTSKFDQYSNFCFFFHFKHIFWRIHSKWMNDIRESNIWYKKDLHWSLGIKKFRIVTKPKMILRTWKDFKSLLSSKVLRLIMG